MKNETKTIKVNYLARVEGEGSLHVKIKGGKIRDIKFKIFEAPRFFEALLEGRSFLETPDITARICGICPIAYQISSVNAMEDACGFKADERLNNLRRLIYCGEWIESHALHVVMLHAPDFLGHDSIISMVKDHGRIVEKGLQVKKMGNEIVSLLGGREIHPINIRVGGFYRLPSRKELDSLKKNIKIAINNTKEIIAWVSRFTFPSFEQDYEFVSLSHPDEYPIQRGKLISNKGLDIAVNQYDDHFEEEHIPYTNALHSFIKGRGAYFVGPLARINLNFDKLPSSIRKLARSVGFSVPCTNPFKSIIARGLEILYALEEASRLISLYKEGGESFTNVTPKNATGYGCSEAPRGTLYHRYAIDKKGNIRNAKIVPPTSQNQKVIEKDLYHFVEKNLKLPKDKLSWKCEQAIRNYDPCISCATHFLKLDMEEL